MLKYLAKRNNAGSCDPARITKMTKPVISFAAMAEAPLLSFIMAGLDIPWLWLATSSMPMPMPLYPP